MDDQPTCGKGLAENSTLPAKLGQIVAAMADVLEVHTEALDSSDPHAQAERRAYAKLVEQNRAAAAQLARIASDMAGYRDLPMGRHDMTAMRRPKTVEVFEKLVRMKEELRESLQKTAERDLAMLASMREPTRG
jgi:hypothetical protein